MLEPAADRDRGRALKALLVLLLVMVVVAVGTGGVYLWATGGSGPSVPVEVEIPRGATASEAGRILEDAGVIRSALAFRIAASLNETDDIQAGLYSMRTNMGLSEVFELLGRGPLDSVPTVRITIPEGLRMEQVADRVSKAMDIQRREFLRTARAGNLSLPPYLPAGTPTVEGFLFPQTYEFRTDADADEVIERLVEQFRAEAEGLDWSRAERLGVTPYEVVIIASLIEREARVPEDRAKVSAVIYNRLQRGMRLQIDATVQYALPEHKPRLTYEDYEYPSPYNTYLHDGLPPTPIASPGLASLQAALEPADVPFLYYVVIDEDGRHAFTASYEEFLRLKAEAQQDAP